MSAYFCSSFNIDFAMGKTPRVGKFIRLLPSRGMNQK
jgi:hypothetical protein